MHGVVKIAQFPWKTRGRSLRLLGWAGVALVCAEAAAAGPTAEYEAPPTLRAADLLPADALHGPHHRVAAPVQNDGYLNHYEIVSDFGRFYAGGDGLLHERVREIGAIAQLREMKTSEAYAEGLKAAAKSPFVAARSLVMNPVGTVQDLGAGVHGVFQGLSERVQHGGRGATEDGAGKELLGFSEAKRQYAYALEVDPYSTNVVLQAELNDLAWASFAGGLPIRVASVAVPAAAGARAVGATLTTLRLTDKTRQRLRDEPPSSLQAGNRERLRTMRVPDRDIDALFDNPTFSPRHETELTDALVGLQGVKNGRALVARAAGARSESEAVFFVRNAQLYSLYHRQAAPLRAIVEWHGYALGQAKDGHVVIATAVDYLPWTQRTAGIIDGLLADRGADARGQPIEVWLVGEASPLSKQALATRGITLHERSFAEKVQP